MPAMNVPSETLDLIESTAVSDEHTQQNTMLHQGSLQNPTESQQDSPFFGSTRQSSLFDAPRIDRSAEQKQKNREMNRQKEEYRYSSSSRAPFLLQM
jgi:hypothetical protein